MLLLRELYFRLLDGLTRNPDDAIGKADQRKPQQVVYPGAYRIYLEERPVFPHQDMKYVRPAFEDLLKRLQTDYIDPGMIHYVDSEEEWENILSLRLYGLCNGIKNNDVIRHIGMSSHNPKVAVKAAASGFVEMILSASIRLLICFLPAKTLTPCLQMSLMQFKGN